MADTSSMSERQVWMKAGEIISAHGAMTADYIIEQLGAVLDDPVAVEDWRRIAAAVDEITDAASSGSN